MSLDELANLLRLIEGFWAAAIRGQDIECYRARADYKSPVTLAGPS